MRTPALCCLVVLLTACATAPAVDYAALEGEYRRSIPVCEDEEQCEMMWSAARRWVTSNAGWKIQNITDSYIETYNPTTHSPYLAARVSKTPLGDGKYRIEVELWCNNLFGCIPHPMEAAVDFNRSVRAAAGIPMPVATGGPY